MSRPAPRSNDAQDDWRKAILPDGRVVEYVDTVLVSRDGDDFVADCTVLVDGELMRTERVHFRSDGSDRPA